ncbi:hypothetical protein BC834DRAFT_861622 [Gloeopeniophorella convolvens]|nr:hypothetical protein BC834DRAFT_861622 [Gloeopeniophorella convolvens]
MIEGRAREGIERWEGAEEGLRAREDAEDAEDEDFVVRSGSSDGGSPTGSESGSGSDADGGGGSGAEEEEDDDGSAQASGDEDEDDGEGEDEDADEALDPAHHPLLRAGALPKMTRAAMDAAVGIVVGDLAGPGPPRQAAAPASASVSDAEEEEDAEEDELDD